MGCDRAGGCDCVSPPPNVKDSLDDNVVAAVAEGAAKRLGKLEVKENGGLLVEGASVGFPESAASDCTKENCGIPKGGPPFDPPAATDVVVGVLSRRDTPEAVVPPNPGALCMRAMRLPGALGTAKVLEDPNFPETAAAAAAEPEEVVVGVTPPFPLGAPPAPGRGGGGFVVGGSEVLTFGTDADEVPERSLELPADTSPGRIWVKSSNRSVFLSSP